MNLARRTDPSTSHSAAQRVEDFLWDHNGRITAALEAVGPGTIYEISDRTGIDHVSCARRMKELEMGARVQRTGETKLGPRGRRCTVWEHKAPL